MKPIAFILSLFVLLLSMVPCSDAHTCDDDMGEKPIEITSSHDHSEDQGDDCTSLCSCSCCGIHITVTGSQNLVTVHSIALSDHMSLYKAPYSFQPIAGIWHPPSLS